MKFTRILLVIVFAIAISPINAQKQRAFKAKEIYKTDRLVITQIGANSFEHTSFLQTNDFGNVPCNGLVVRSNNETVVFDTPTNDTSSEELIKWINDSLHCTIKAIVPTHFHNDCLGGLNVFHQSNIPSYAYYKTGSTPYKLEQFLNLHTHKEWFF